MLPGSLPWPRSPVFFASLKSLSPSSPYPSAYTSFLLFCCSVSRNWIPNPPRVLGVAGKFSLGLVFSGPLGNPIATHCVLEERCTSYSWCLPSYSFLEWAAGLSWLSEWSYDDGAGRAVLQ
ncbi:hypothetical protein HJG60_010483 [Phyllostomus discolor]|uniref:Uncharacterized protein n=1 Tax=Phyllostomus discolor TaxID=89673 RepID=A0A834EET6_9CHIR|nr:hypothetical protein HJG60_010483 [Phyllostomus discolor]